MIIVSLRHSALRLSSLFFAASLSAFAQTPANPAYTATDLGTLGGTSSTAYGINNSGQIVGISYITGSVFHATRFNSDGSLTDLGTLGGNYSYAYGINDSGQIVGYSGITSDSTWHATRFNPDGSITDLGTLGGTSSYAQAINEAGQIAGFSQITGDSATHATRFNPDGTLTDLGTLGGTHSGAHGINNSGQIAGYSQITSDSARHATRFNPDGSLTDLGTLGGTNSLALAINDSGQIAGYSHITSDSATHATRFNPDGSLTDLGTLGGTDSVARAINEAGQIVGNSEIVVGSSATRGFLYSGGVMSDVNDLVLPGSGITNINLVSIGNSINDWGQIAAQGLVPNGQTHAVLLNPVDPLTTATGDSRNTKFIGGMGYEKFTASTHSAGLGTTVDLLGGTTGSGGHVSYAEGGFGLNRDVTLTLIAGTGTSLASDIVSIDGTFSDLIVLSLTYDESLFGHNVALGWFDDGANEWTLAVDGNTGETNTPTFIEGAYDPDSHFHPGYHGVDLATHTAWAVINHNSDFAVIQAIPEPATSALILLASGALLLRRRPKTASLPSI